MQVEGERKRLSGIRGLLLVFIICMIISPVSNLVAGISCLVQPSILLILLGVIFLILAGYGFYVAYLLVRRRTTAPRHAERILILSLVPSVFIVILTYLATNQLDLMPLLQSVGIILLLGYLYWFPRVFNTYYNK